MLTLEDLDTLNELARKIDPSDYFIFDVRLLTTGLDDRQAGFLVWVHNYSSKICGAIVDLYNEDVTGCLDSGLL